MDISYHGGNCIEIASKQLTLITDAALSQVGLKDITPKEAVFVATQKDFLPRSVNGVVVDDPGEYEIKNISIVGVPARRMIEQDESKNATMYRIVAGGVAFAVVGHVAAPLSEEQLESLGVIDVAIVPVGGSGYTLDAHQAAAVIRQLDPKMVIPTHYADKGLAYEVPQMELEPFLKELSAAHETTSKYKIKNGLLPETLTVVEITRS